MNRGSGNILRRLWVWLPFSIISLSKHLQFPLALPSEDLDCSRGSMRLDDFFFFKFFLTYYIEFGATPPSRKCMSFSISMMYLLYRPLGFCRGTLLHVQALVYM